MRLTPFLLDEWLDDWAVPGAIAHHLASSTGPQWTLRELLDLEPGTLDRALSTLLVYSRSRGSDELRAELGGMLGAPTEEILVMTGASEALHALAAWAAERGGNVVVPAPAYPPTANLPGALGLEVRTYRLQRERAFSVDLDEVRGLLDEKTRILYVNSPHNPTGAVLSLAELTALHELAASRGIAFVSDEVYSPIAAEGLPASAASLPHATVVGDLSKALCLSGLRVGYVREPDPERRAYLVNARQTFTVSNGPLDELLAAVAARNREAIFARARSVVAPNVETLARFLADQKGTLDWVRPAGGMTSFPWLSSGEDARPFCERLARGGVLVVPGDCFQAKEHFRLGFGATEPAAFERALSRFGEILKSPR